MAAAYDRARTTGAAAFRLWSASVVLVMRSAGATAWVDVWM